jgi:flagellar assembly protein FliH
MRKVLRNHEVPDQQRWLPAPAPMRPEEARAVAEHAARDIVTLAQTEADTTIATARTTAAQLRDQAYTEGRTAGSEEGRRSFEERLRDLEALVDEVNAERDAYFAQVEPELVRLAVAIAEKIIDRQLSLTPDVVVDLTRTHLKRLRERDIVRVRANPDDLPLLADARQALMGDVDGVREMALDEDRRVGRGGVVLETAAGSLDVRIASQMDVVRKALGDATETTHDTTGS